MSLLCHVKGNAEFLPVSENIPFRAIGCVQSKLYSVIYEVREDKDDEYYHFVTLWKTTRQEEELYEKNCNGLL